MPYFDKVGDRLESIGRNFGGALQNYLEKKNQAKNYDDLIKQFEGKIAPAQVIENPFASRETEGLPDFSLGLDLSGSGNKRADERAALGREVDALGVLGELANENKLAEPGPEKTRWPEMDITGLGVYGDNAPKLNIPSKDFNSQIADAMSESDTSPIINSLANAGIRSTGSAPEPYEQQIETKAMKLPSAADVLLARAFAGKRNPGQAGTDFLDEIQKVLDSQEKARLQKELIGLRGNETINAIGARTAGGLEIAGYNWGQKNNAQQTQHGMNIERDERNNNARLELQEARAADALKMLRYRFENLLKNHAKVNNPEALQASVLSYDAAIDDAQKILPTLGDPMISKEAASYINYINAMRRSRQSIEAKLAASRVNAGMNPVPQRMQQAPTAPARQSPPASKRFQIVSVK